MSHEDIRERRGKVPEAVPECATCQLTGGPAEINRPDIVCAMRVTAETRGVRQLDKGRGFFCSVYWRYGDIDKENVDVTPFEDFIAHAPTDIDTLLTENDAQAKTIGELRAAIGEHLDCRVLSATGPLSCTVHAKRLCSRLALCKVLLDLRQPTKQEGSE